MSTPPPLQSYSWNQKKLANPRSEWTLKNFLTFVGAIATALIVLVVVLDKLVLPLWVSSKDVVTVPNFVGRKVAPSKRYFDSLGLQVMEVREQFNAAIPAGIITSQMPLPNTEVKEGRRVYLTVSKGIEVIAMPYLIGKTQRDARLALLRLGLQLGTVTSILNDSIPPNFIVAQSLSTDSKVVPGTTVDLVVSGGPSRVAVPELKHLSALEAEALLFESGLKVQLEYSSDGSWEPNTVTNQMPAPGDTVAVGSVITIVVNR